VTEEMSGGLRHHKDEENGPRAMRLETNRRKIVTLSERHSAFALTRDVCSKPHKTEELKT